MIRYALISVSDKNGIDLLAAELVKLGFRIISTGGTAKFLNEREINTTQVSDLTGFPEIMDGRVKTLHPKVHGGILADLDNQNHLQIMKELNINPIEIVVVNLYPFAETVVNPESSEEDIIENIDIGGPTLIRSAAKNFKHVVILTEPEDYAETLSQLSNQGTTTYAWRKKLALRAFSHVESYDHDIAEYFNAADEANHFLPPAEDELQLNKLVVTAPLAQALRYGENPHQKAGYFSRNSNCWQQLHGKPLSYNNLLDLDAALQGILLFDKPTVMIFKHTNPCGIGSGDKLPEAYQKAFDTDPLSPFGGIIIVNCPLDIDTVHKINEIFTEIIIAPDFDYAALELLKKRKDRRLVSYIPDLVRAERHELGVKSIVSGYLVQEWDKTVTLEEDWQIVTTKQPTKPEMEALRFAWRTVSILKSNAIALTSHDRTYGLGMGQTSRIDSTEIAIRKALQFGHDLSASVCASDGFFPFRDSIELIAGHGIKAVIQPGGSRGDEDVIAACNELNISMIMTGMRHFRH
jgi:phosphoribosylaminoimidazolecarboxamide formyltransferase/IMP cyclohydrolase